MTVKTPPLYDLRDNSKAGFHGERGKSISPGIDSGKALVIGGRRDAAPPCNMAAGVASPCPPYNNG